MNKSVKTIRVLLVVMLVLLIGFLGAGCYFLFTGRINTSPCIGFAFRHKACGGCFDGFGIESAPEAGWYKACGAGGR